MAKHNWSNTAVITNLSALLSDVALSLTVNDGTGYPASNFKIWIDNEVIFVGTRTGTTFSSLTREYDGTPAAEHQSGAAVRHVTSAEDFQTRFIGFPLPEPGVGQAGHLVQYDHANLEMDWVDPTAADFIDHGALAGLTDDDHAGYHTDSRALTWLGTRSTTDLPEGTNEYYTDGKADARAALQDHDHDTPIATHAAITGAHHAQVHGLVSADHTVSGLTTGDVLRANSISTFGFATLVETDISDLHTRYTDAEADARAALLDHDHDTPIATHAAITGAHHAQVHGLLGTDHTVSGLTAGDFLKATGTTTFDFATLVETDISDLTHYNDSDAVNAMGILGDANDLNHNRYTDAEADARASLQDHDHDTPIATHAAITTAHHTKYTDAEAVTAVATDDAYLKLVGDTMGGNINMASTYTVYNLVAPTNPGDAVSKTYAESNFLGLGGGTLTGALTLNAAPTADLHSSTKKYVDDKNLPPTVFSSGDIELETKTGTGRLKMPYACTLVSTTATCGVAPTGANVIVDVNKNGTTMYSGTKPSITAGSQDGSAATPSTSAIASGDVITVDVDQIGSTLPGENLTVILRIETP